MDPSLNKSLSDTDVNLLGNPNKTPPNYVFERVKRTREDMDACLSRQLHEFKEEMRKMMSHFSVNQGNEMSKISATLKEIQLSNANIENSISFLTAQNDEFKKKIHQLEIEAKKDKEYIVTLENKFEDMQIGSRKSNFVIKNVPKKNNETKDDLLDLTTFLAQSIDCKINKYDIKDIYRLRGTNRDNNQSPIIVETSSTLLKNEILKMVKAFNIKHKTKLCCKHLGFKTQEDTPIFITEHLTTKGSRLHFLARDLVKSGAFKYCWTAYGKVYVKKDDQSQTIVIKSEDQIHRLTLQK